MSIDIRRENKEVRDNSQLQVLLSLKRNIMRELNVGSLGEVEKIDNDIITVNLFPAYEETNELKIQCYKLKDLEIKEKDVVVILFLDLNFKQNLLQTRSNQIRSKLSKNNKEYHSKKFGIIIGII